MKKLIAGIALATTLGTSNAMSIPAYIGAPRPTHYDAGYHNGYRHGKADTYKRVATTVVITGAVVMAGILIYKLGEDSRWGMNNEGQVTYKF